MVLLCGIMPLTELATVSAAGAAVQSAYATGDIITLGTYPQTKVTDSGLITNLNAQTLGADGTVTCGGGRYKRVYFTQYISVNGGETTNPANSIQDDNGYYINTVYWFKFEPIQWRVLSNAGGELYVMSEKILASRAYNQLLADVTWETCTLRSWLNNDFYNTAFNAAEQAKIKTSAVVNEDNPWYGTDGGNNTADKVFLLSYSEVMDSAHGFNSSYSAYDVARRAQGTDFAKSNGLNVSTNSSYLGNSNWWLRTPGSYQYLAGLVDYHGYVYGTDYPVHYTPIGARPALKLNLTSEILTSKSGSACVVDRHNGFIYGLDPGIQSLADYAQVAPGYEMEYEPTVGGFGTGTQVHATLGGNAIESYYLIIFGDVNGDGNIDTTDAVLIVDYDNFLIDWDPARDAAMLKAADLNGDGNIDTADAGLIVDVENFLLTINQTTGMTMPA